MNTDSTGSSIRQRSLNNERSVKLLLLRHGEREDEAIKRSMSIEERKRNALLPKELQQVEIDSLDPALTERGYEQAMEAWKKILHAISHHQNRLNRKAQVTLVCSPLRRCIGTSLMIVSALPLIEDATGNRNTIEFCGTIDPNVGSSAVASGASTRKVPIHVMNGLATCAAAIFKFGGVTRTIQQFGYDIPCAVIMNENSHSSQQPTINLFNAALQSMINVARRPFQVKSQPQTRSLASSSSCVQYYGMPNPTDDLSLCAFPLSFEITSQLALVERMEHNHDIHHQTTPDEDNGSRTTSFATPERTRPDPVTKYTTTTRKAINNRDHYNESFMGALNQAVHFALNNTTSTSEHNPNDDEAIDRYVVVITHREGIRSLIDHCTNVPNYTSTPYCCIGTFTATTTTESRSSNHISSRNVNETSKPEIRYAAQNVSPYEHFTI